AYGMRGDRASWRVRVEAGDGSRLTWRGQGFVVCDGAQVERSTTVDLGTGAVVVLRELLVLGRTGEAGGRLHTTTRVAQAGPLLVEDLPLDGSEPRVGVLGGARVLETVSVLGRRAAATDLAAPAHRLELDGEGTLLRWWGTHAHEGGLGHAWLAVTRDLLLPGGRPTSPTSPLPPSVPPMKQTDAATPAPAGAAAARAAPP
ncbi:MAG: urease accessory protein UreD, partial [Actinomycetota bacterium]|nr:urease accessory protein UreD [Actinomycetota bacterium]